MSRPTDDPVSLSVFFKFSVHVGLSFRTFCVTAHFPHCPFFVKTQDTNTRWRNITDQLEDASKRYKKATSAYNCFDPKDAPVLMTAYRGTGKKITFPIDDTSRACFDKRIRAALLNKNSDRGVVDAAIKIYTDADGFITTLLEDTSRARTPPWTGAWRARAT
jgi:hypothetical protein